MEIQQEEKQEIITYQETQERRKRNLISLINRLLFKKLVQLTIK